MHWQGGPSAPDDIKRRFRLNERMLRYMTVFSEGPLAAPVRTEADGSAPAAESPAAASGTERESGSAPVMDSAPAATADGPPAE
jgi:hypothetical protein